MSSAPTPTGPSAQAAMSSANIEDIVIKNRLLFDPRQMRKALKRFLALGLGESIDMAVRKEASADFLSELDILQVAMGKFHLIEDMTVRESAHFEQERLRIETEIAEANADIERLKEELVDAQTRKQNKIEYEAIAKEVHKLPSREHTENLVKNTLEEIEQLEVERAGINGLKDHRMKHLMNMVASIHEFQDIFKGASGFFDDAGATGASFSRKGYHSEEEGAYGADNDEDEEGAIQEEPDAMDTS
ncbi:hypothetical protein BASA83_008865 [Batrachochytrium salamandrivorans]|nr:hypothetical protein BASA62_006158 [Batrachochytrium salamandrivorans]KAH9256761.1 hypothetical protein BASA81_005055 [Batrachochytrium salamandrivorans]KAH9269114.1 hypothetical protein BASA83_008865 [Batrachochytrium salamandrivorans]